MTTVNEDTICAPATIPGTGAISVIRISGTEALSIADRVVKCGTGSLSESRGYTIHFGTVFQADGRPLDEVLASVFRAPHSYTGENSVEISCHASKFITDSIMLRLVDAGCRVALPGEFTQRAFLNGKMDLAQAEAVADLIASQSEASHRVAFSQMKGGFSSELKDMRSKLLDIVSLMELELDFSEEEVEFADRGQLDDLLDKVLSHIGNLTDSFRLGNAIKNGIPVAIVGATNTGKSTLLNTLLGEDRAIVSDIHGTTRDTVEETMNVGGVLFRFVDTAGIRETTEAVEQIGIERTFKKISQARIVLGMLDSSADDATIASSVEKIISNIDLSHQTLVFLLNKTDLLDESAYNKKIITLNNIVKSIDNNKFNLTDDNRFNSIDVNKFNSVDNNKLGTFDDNKFNSIEDNKRAPIKLIGISAKNQIGTDALKNHLSSISTRFLGDTDATLVTNVRHYEALRNASDSLRRVKAGLTSGVPTDLVSQDIREALYHLGSIVGEISTDEVLGNIFRNFCIGK